MKLIEFLTWQHSASYGFISLHCCALRTAVLPCFQNRWWFVVSDWVWELWNSSSPQQRRKSLELRLYSICDWWWGQGLPGNQRMKEGEAPSLQSLLDWGIMIEWCAGERSMIWCLAGAIQEFIVLLSWDNIWSSLRDWDDIADCCYMWNGLKYYQHLLSISVGEINNFPTPSCL